MINKIKTSIREDYDAYRKEFENSVSSNVKIIDSVLSYIMKKKGGTYLDAIQVSQ